MADAGDRLRSIAKQLRARPKSVALWALGALFAVVAFGPLARFDPEPTLEREFEGVFFQPSGASPSLVLLMAAWLGYRRLGRLVNVPPLRGTIWPAAALVAVAGLTLAWSAFVGARDLRTVALMLTIQGFACGYGGLRAMRILAVPTSILVFAIPMPAPLLNALLTQMQLWTAEFAGRVLYQAGIAAYVSGIEIVVDSSHFAIIETCSGVRITETLSMLTILMLDLFRRRGLHAAILLALTLPVAFLFNTLRAVSLILNPYSEIVQIHALQGIAMLIGGILVLYFIDGLLAWVLRAPRTRAAGTSGAADAARPRAWLATASLAVLAAISLAISPWGPLPRPPYPGLRMDFLEMPGWEASELKADRRFLGRIGIHWDLSRRFRQDREFVDLYLGVGNRSERAASVLFSKGLLQGGGWHTERTPDEAEDWEAPEALAGEAGSPQSFSQRTGRTQVVVSLARRFLLLSWHERAGGLLEESARSFLALDRSPLRRSGTPLVVRISTAIGGRDPELHRRAQTRLQAFATVLAPKLAAFQQQALEPLRREDPQEGKKFPFFLDLQ